MVTNALLARCCNWRITSTSRLCHHWQSDKVCRLWMKKFLQTIFFGASLSTSIDGFCGLRDRPTSLLPTYIYGATRRACSHEKVHTRDDCSAATTTRRKPGNSQGAMNVGVSVPSYTLTHMSNFTHKFHHQVAAQYFCIYYYTQLLHVSAKNSGHFQGVTSLVDGNPVHGQLSLIIIIIIIIIITVFLYYICNSNYTRQPWKWQGFLAETCRSFV